MPADSPDPSDQQTVTTEQEGPVRDDIEGDWGTDTHSGDDSTGGGDDATSRNDREERWGIDDDQWGESGWDDAEPHTQEPRSPVGPEREGCDNCGSAAPLDAQYCPECGTPVTTQSAESTKEPLSRLRAVFIGGVAGFFLEIFFGLILIVGTVLSLSSSLLAGALSGYLRGPDTRESTITGGLAGVIATIPHLLLFGWQIMLFWSEMFSHGWTFIPIMFAVADGPLVGALGGALGAKVSNRAAPKDSPASDL